MSDTLVCHACGQSLRDGPALCKHCGSLQPYRPDLNLFAVLGVPESFTQDTASLRRRALALQQGLHPDRFAQGSAADQRRSLEWSTRVNEALSVLSDPLARGDYLFTRRFGHSALGEKQGSLRDPALLMQQMEYREQLETLDAEQDRVGLEALRKETRAAAVKLDSDLQQAFADPHATAEALARYLVEWQYLRKLQAEMDRLEDRWDYL